jgi:hypothetical protein
LVWVAFAINGHHRSHLPQCAHPPARLGRLLFADDAAQLVEADFLEAFLIERRRAG